MANFVGRPTNFALLPKINVKADLLKPSTSVSPVELFEEVIDRPRVAEGIITLQELYQLGDHYWREQIEEHIEDHCKNWLCIKEHLWSHYEDGIDAQLFRRFISHCKQIYDEVVQQQNIVERREIDEGPLLIEEDEKESAFMFPISERDEDRWKSTLAPRAEDPRSFNESRDDRRMMKRFGLGKQPEGVDGIKKEIQEKLRKEIEGGDDNQQPDTWSIDKIPYELMKEQCANDKCCQEFMLPINDDEKKEEAKTQIKKQKFEHLQKNCKPFRRIKIVLNAYARLINEVNKEKWPEIDIGDVIKIEKEYNVNNYQKKYEYGHQQIYDDFHHINRYHIVADTMNCDSTKNEYHEIGKSLCQDIQKESKCKYSNDIQNCMPFTRHYRDRTNDEREQSLYRKKRSYRHENYREINDEIAFQQECDKMHCFFLHSTVKFGTSHNETNKQEEDSIDMLNKYVKGRSFSRSQTAIFEKDPAGRDMPSEYRPSAFSGIYGSYRKSYLIGWGNTQQYEDSDDDTGDDETTVLTNTKIQKSKYVGKKQDHLWWEDVKTGKYEHQSSSEIYRILVENMGVFRWQNPQLIHFVTYLTFAINVEFY